jgi:hypothetical protein
MIAPLWCRTVADLTLMMHSSAPDEMASLPLMIAATEGPGPVVAPLPSSAMMGLALIGGFLLFGRVRPRKHRRRRARL